MKLLLFQLTHILGLLMASYGLDNATTREFNPNIFEHMAGLDPIMHQKFCTAVNYLLPTRFILHTHRHRNLSTTTINQFSDNFENHLDPDKDVLIIIHEYLRGCDKPFTLGTIKAYFQAKPEVQVMTVCWDAAFPRLERRVGKELGLLGYWPSTLFVPCVGDLVAKFLMRLHNEVHVPWSRMSIATHSLGCQLAGDAGNKVGGKLGKIIALDPAVPFYGPSPLYTSLLRKTSAEQVMVLHTSVGQFSMGTVDFYANSLWNQPGCELWLATILSNPSAIFDFLLCNHSRSFELFIESVLNGSAFLATECSNHLAYEMGLCHFNAKTYFGPDTKATGTYYFTTTGTKPYY